MAEGVHEGLEEGRVLLIDVRLAGWDSCAFTKRAMLTSDRRTAVQLMKSSPAPIPIHLNERVTHFSALVPIECEATGRQMRDATKNAKGVVIL